MGKKINDSSQKKMREISDPEDDFEDKRTESISSSALDEREF